MHERLERARDAVDSAREITDDADSRAQLASIREGLERVDDGVREDQAGDPLEDPQAGDRLESLERQLTELGDDVADLVESHLKTARDEIDAYRREHAADWDREA